MNSKIEAQLSWSYRWIEAHLVQFFKDVVHPELAAAGISADLELAAGMRVMLDIAAETFKFMRENIPEQANDETLAKMLENFRRRAS